MVNEARIASSQSGRMSAALQRVLRQLPMGALERQAIEAGEIDAVIDYGRANVIVFPAARRALRDSDRHASAAVRATSVGTPARNSLLAALPRVDLARLLLALEPVMLEPGDVLYEDGAPVRQVYFPVDGVVVLLTKIDSQQTVATGLVGHEGMVGMPLALGVGCASVRAVVSVGGSAFRMPAMRFLDEFQRGLPLQRHLYRYAQDQLNLARQTAACTASHPLEQRLACWLLMIGDRARSTVLLLTQEQLANNLNVRRSSITLAFRSLCSRGLVDHSRGRISILDRDGLEAVSCPCYRPVAPQDAARRARGPR